MSCCGACGGEPSNKEKTEDKNKEQANNQTRGQAKDQPTETTVNSVEQFDPSKK